MARGTSGHPARRPDCCHPRRRQPSTPMKDQDWGTAPLSESAGKLLSGLGRRAALVGGYLASTTTTSTQLPPLLLLRFDFRQSALFRSISPLPFSG